MLEDDGFVRIGRVTFQAPSTVAIHIDRREAQSWDQRSTRFEWAARLCGLGKLNPR